LREREKEKMNLSGIEGEVCVIYFKGFICEND